MARGRRGAAGVERFYLYGEPPGDVEHDFVHVETIFARSGPAKGEIRPHTHAALTHVFVIEAGEGEVLADERRLSFAGPVVVFVPAGLVHGFRFSPRVSGYVITSASAYLRGVLPASLRGAPALESAVVLPLPPETREELCALAVRLMRELGWGALLAREAVAGCFKLVLVGVGRLAEQAGRESGARAAGHVRLLAAFRALVEAHYREDWKMEVYLAALRVSEAQLRYACARGGEASPAQMILARRVIEAKRLLIYSDIAVAECGLSVGFNDPAYFSRAFAKAAGLAPGAYRRAHRPDRQG
ncbi:helix-turn-helix domain-containing protein [Acidocella sp.]|uniref:helix-turn-helix domain-containing protein n=1 Tax=Acidocella sp. TaxID=50710 RepID=UPI002625DB5F|nr:helix-turn-helix domain-containing protein [Acidocella sp.]